MTTFVKNTLTKSEILRGEKNIEKIFKDGLTFYEKPFKVKYLKNVIHVDFPAVMAISVPKRITKKAVGRNHIKRLVRESYRKQKKWFYDELAAHNKTCALFLIYTGNIEIDYSLIEQKIILILHRLLKD